MESSCSSLNSDTIAETHRRKERIEGPILLLDELMDTEHSDLAKAVGNGLLRLTARGGNDFKIGSNTFAGLPQ